MKTAYVGPAASIVDLPTVEALFDPLNDVAFFVKDNEGCYVAVNHTMVRRCGLRKKEDLIGKRALDVLPRLLAQTYTAQDQQVIRSGLPIKTHLELHVYPTRDRGWCLTNKTPLRDIGGRIIGLMGTSQDLGLPDDQHPVYRKVAEIATHIREHCFEDISVTDLVEDAGLSLSRVERMFRRVFHCSPRQFLLSARLNAAMTLIETRPSTSIGCIADKCGYSDHSAFSRQFKAHTGMSPIEYRTQCIES
ncbi:AraC family transcriptional regulator [Massilia phyllosphaerae]|uniref:AraC family transcriptional regulator n=1 Tax=Massilia phyllosphaerae TaxID=3106034 RepID=UPI002B1CD242|nr:AraC family transcriptional regulator [Massilia sp. SGZ-792]